MKSISTEKEANIHANDKFMEKKKTQKVPSKKEMKHYIPYLEVAVS